jgi:replicative DNA helicase
VSDIERRLLARLTTPEDISLAYDSGTRSVQFEEPLASAVFSFILNYWQNSQMKSAPTDWVLKQEFPGYQPLEGATEETEYLAESLKAKYLANQVQDLLRGTAKISVSDPGEALKMLRDGSHTLSEAVSTRRLRTNMAETIEVRRERYGQREEAPQGLGVPYGLDLLDIHTGGLMPGEVAVVGAFAKTGKTMFGLHTAAQIVKQGYRPLVYTLEMSLKECEDRLDCMYSGVSYDRLIHGRLSPSEIIQLHKGQEELKEVGGIQIERPEEGDRTVMALMSRARQYGADWVFIDQLSHMEPGVKTQTLKEHHGTLVKQLKNEVSRSGQEIPCLLAAQLRRGDEVITMESFANASEIEREVDMALGLHRNNDMRENGMMNLEILGSRRSDSGSWELLWELKNKTEIRILRAARS